MENDKEYEKWTWNYVCTYMFYIIIIILENKEYHKVVNVGKRRHVDIRRFFHQMQKRRIEEPYPAIF